MNIDLLTSLSERSIIANVDGVSISSATISTNDFVNIPNHHTWNEEARAEGREGKARGKHLSVFAPTMVNVAMCVYPDGEVERVDGNSRSWFIRNDKMTNVPNMLVCTIYAVSTQADSVKIFEAYDNPHATDKASDSLAYAYTALDMTVVTPKLKSSATTPAKLAYGLLFDEPNKGLKIVAIVGQLTDGIKLLDTLRLGVDLKVSESQKVGSGAIAAYIAICQKHDAYGLAIVKEFIKSELTNALFAKDAKYGGQAGKQTSIHLFKHLETTMIERGLIQA